MKTLAYVEDGKIYLSFTLTMIMAAVIVAGFFFNGTFPYMSVGVTALLVLGTVAGIIVPERALLVEWRPDPEEDPLDSLDQMEW